MIQMMQGHALTILSGMPRDALFDEEGNGIDAEGGGDGQKAGQLGKVAAIFPCGHR